jgi:hypothetical protein
MNLAQLKKNVGWRVQLEPPAIHLDGIGRELPSRNEDWIIQNVTEAEVRIDEATALPLTTTLGSDSVHHFTSNPARSAGGGIQYGFLVLAVQMYIQNDKISFRPCARPGERVPPLPVQIAQKWVDFTYPVASGIQERLEGSGWRVAWLPESRLPTLELDGWEVIVEKDRHGMPTSFHLRDPRENQVYAKTRERDLEALAHSPYFRNQPGFVSCSISADRRALVFRFDGPVNAVAFQMRMSRGPSGIRCEMMPGRVDTVLGYLSTS